MKKNMIYARGIALRIHTPELRQALPPIAERERNVLVYAYAKNEYAVVFRFGVVVFWNITIAKQNEFLKNIDKFVKSPLDPQQTRHFNLTVGQKNSVDWDHLHVHTLDVAHVIALSFPIAQSVVLSRMELEVDAQLYNLNRILRPIQKTGKIPMKKKELIMKIGEVLRNRTHAFYEFGFEDTPDDAWDDDGIEKLYIELREELEINQRIKHVGIKWNTVTEEMQFVLSLVTERTDLHIELLLVFFALTIDIILTAWEIFGH